jgi:hypothetical protein
MKSRKEMEQTLIEKALKDDNYKNDLMKDPGKMLEAEFGLKVPDSFTIRVVEEKPKEFILVLPHKYGKSSKEELTEAELEQVSGGTYWTFLYNGMDEGY